MPYKINFKHADDIIADLDTYLPNVVDPMLKIKYVGFVSVAGVTCYENAVKEICCTYADSINQTFGTFVSNYFERINGRIRINNIRGDYLSKFGDSYCKAFDQYLRIENDEFLKSDHRDFMTAYENLITWRHAFTHEGSFRTSTTTYEEVVQAYQDGKMVLSCLHSSLFKRISGI
jgi:hypothetical protein